MKNFLIVCGLLLFLGSNLFGQQIRVTGTVVDANDRTTLPGVSVFVKGTTQGTVTDMNGRYELTVASDAVLVFSFIGMSSREVNVGGRSVIDVSLQTDMVGLDEVVVVGYGVQRREAATGSVSVVGEQDLRNMPVTSPERLLQGKVAGLQLNSVTGQPGSATQIRIRGFSSINASSEPLYVIDGVPIVTGDFNIFTSTGNTLANLNPGDIESITVLKDAAAASVYGSRAANGVILITTKRGRAGQPTRVNFRTRAGFSQKANDNDYRFMSPDEIYSYNRQAIVNSGFDPETYGVISSGALFPGFYAGETLPGAYPEGHELAGDAIGLFDWEDAAFRQAQLREYEFNVTGATQNTSYFSSLNYTSQEGIMIATGHERISFRSNVDQRVSDIFKVGSNLNASYSFMDDRPNQSLFFVNPFWASINLLPWHLPYNEDGSYNHVLPSNANTNFIASANHEDQWEKQYRVLGSVFAELMPIEGLTIRSQNSVELINGEGRRWWSPLADPSETGTLQVSNTRLERYTTTNTINYATNLFGVHNVRALVGQEAFIHNFNYHYAYGTNIGAEIPHLNRATQDDSRVSYSFNEYSLMSFFGILDYGYDDRYFAQFSLRNDGNSKFGSENRWATFWSVGGSWNIHSENFMSELDFVNMLKLRASYGINGNDGIGIYDQWGTYSSAGSAYNGVSGVNPSRIPNTTLTWELNRTYNIGLDFALFRGLQGTFDIYHRNTESMLLNRPISRTSGASAFRINVGELVNQGVEGSLSYNTTIGDLNLNLRANAGRNNVEIIDLGGEEEIGDGFWRRFRVGGGYSDYYVYDWAGVNPANGQSLYYNEDGDLTPLYSEARRVFEGKIEPNIFGGFGSDFNYRGFGLSVFFDYKIGHYVYIMESRYTRSDGFNWGANQNASLLDYWKQPGDVVPNPKPLVNNSMGANEWGTSRFLERGDYLRLRDVTLSYDLPRNLLQNARIHNARIFVNATNLYTWHDVSYWDPERGVTGGGYIVFPLAKSFSIGVDIQL